MEPFSATSLLSLKEPRVRVTVSREAPMNSPICSWVSRKRHRVPFSGGLAVLAQVQQVGGRAFQEQTKRDLPYVS